MFQMKNLTIDEWRKKEKQKEWIINHFISTHFQWVLFITFWFLLFWNTFILLRTNGFYIFTGAIISISLGLWGWIEYYRTHEIVDRYEENIDVLHKRFIEANEHSILEKDWLVFGESVGQEVKISEKGHGEFTVLLPGRIKTHSHFTDIGLYDSLRKKPYVRKISECRWEPYQRAIKLLNSIEYSNNNYFLTTKENYPVFLKQMANKTLTSIFQTQQKTAEIAISQRLTISGFIIGGYSTILVLFINTLGIF